MIELWNIHSQQMPITLRWGSEIKCSQVVYVGSTIGCKQNCLIPANLRESRVAACVVGHRAQKETNILKSWIPQNSFPDGLWVYAVKNPEPPETYDVSIQISDLNTTCWGSRYLRRSWNSHSPNPRPPAIQSVPTTAMFEPLSNLFRITWKPDNRQHPCKPLYKAR